MCDDIDLMLWSTEGAVIRDVAESLYQRHYKSFSLYIFAFLYIIRDTAKGYAYWGGGVKWKISGSTEMYSVFVARVLWINI